MPLYRGIRFAGGLSRLSGWRPQRWARATATAASGAAAAARQQPFERVLVGLDRGAPRRIATQTARPSTRPRSPSEEEGGSVSIWSTIQAKFIPKKPVTKVSGRKIVATTVSQYMVSLSRRSISFAIESAAASIAATSRFSCS